MKQLHTLGLTICMLCVCTLITAQQASAPDNTKVVIIKKKSDASGQQSVERVIVTDSEHAELMLLETSGENKTYSFQLNGCGDKLMRVENSEGVKQHNKSVTITENNGEKLLTIEIDGQTETITLAEGEGLSQADRELLAAKGIYLNHLNEAPAGEGQFDIDFDFDFDLDLKGFGEGFMEMGKGLAKIGEGGHAWVYRPEESRINCAALGVYITTNHGGGVFVNGIIGASGAEQAGLQRGDIITSIDDDATTTYRELHEALAKHEPGDVVTVTYSRDGVEDRVESQLRAWKELTGFENSRHALVTCGEQPVAEETITRKIIVIKKDKAEPAVPENLNQSPVVEALDNSLILTDFVAFPNPTDGKFNVQFSAEEKPTVVSVFDASGKEVFRDKLQHFSGYYNREIDLSSHARGALVLSVEQDGKSFTEQIILH